MMCIISKERIAFCAQVEGTRGVVFAASPIALQSRCKRVPNEPIPTYGHSWPSPPECSFKIGDRQSEKKRWNSDRRAICNVTCGIKAARGVIRHRGVSDGSDRARRLWRSHTARTEIFFADDFGTQWHPGIVSEEWEWYQLQRLNSVPRRHLEIQTTRSHWHPALISTHEPILVVTMPGVAETFKTVIDEMTHGTDFKLVNFLHPEYANLTPEDMNICIDEPENRRNIHPMSHDTLTSRAKPSSNGWLSYS